MERILVVTKNIRMKIFMLSLLLFTSSSLFGQKDSVGKAMSFFYVGFVKEKIPLYSDSLNNWKKGDDLPHFIFDPLFDIKLTRFWPGSSHPTSFRKIIFDRVTNKPALRAIVDNKSNLLDQKHLPKGSIFESNLGFSPPFYRYSTREIAGMRLDQLFIDDYSLDHLDKKLIVAEIAAFSRLDATPVSFDPKTLKIDYQEFEHKIFDENILRKIQRQIDKLELDGFCPPIVWLRVKLFYENSAVAHLGFYRDNNQSYIVLNEDCFVWDQDFVEIFYPFLPDSILENLPKK